MGRCKKSIFLFAAVLLLLTAPWQGHGARADDKAPPKEIKTPEDLDLVAVGKVKEIKKSDLIVLDNDVTYRLDQIRVPVAYEAVAVDYLKKAILNQQVGIFADKGNKSSLVDRYGNPVGHVLRDDGVWTQADMVTRGLAWATSTLTNHELVLPLYKYETAARKIGYGFWKDPAYGIKTYQNIDKYLNTFQIYQGLITSQNLVNDKYVFTCDGNRVSKGAFSFSIRLDQLPPFMPPGATLSSMHNAWRGATVRLRGWVEKDPSSSNALPNIDVTHPEQMEFINPRTGEPATN